MTVETRAREENFPVASRLLPRVHRSRLLAVYAFARWVDDVGDERPRDEALRLLDTVEDDLRRLYEGDAPRLPVVRGLAPVVTACSIPVAPFLALVQANRLDQAVSRYRTFDDLLAYCELSANPVGRIVLHVFGAATEEHLRLSDRICTALQIVEHCQDVAEDHARGRVYLPAEDLRRFGCSESDLRAASTPRRLRLAVALQVDRAERLLRAGEPLAASLTGLARVAVSGYVAGGQATVAALRRAGHDVLGRSVRPRRTVLAAAWLRLLARGGRHDHDVKEVL
ncbi:squalene synthase HpnC [Nonomuraea pusilla]|uniref:squalene synthase HpnC n=1 Tax=Nonomuraea pusilla TaxID=46177 RepID=UPI003324DA39